MGWMRSSTAVLLVAAILGCAGTRAYDNGVRAAKASYVTYTSLAPVVAKEISWMVKQSQTFGLTTTEKARLRRLDTLGKDLEKYRALHNLYVDVLVLGSETAKLGEVRLAGDGEDPPDITFSKMKVLLRQIIKDALALQLTFNAVRL